VPVSSIDFLVCNSAETVLNEIVQFEKLNFAVVVESVNTRKTNGLQLQTSSEALYPWTPLGLPSPDPYIVQFYRML